MLKLNGKMTKEKWLIILVCGLLLLIIAFPFGGGRGGLSQKAAGEMNGLPADGLQAGGEQADGSYSGSGFSSPAGNKAAAAAGGKIGSPSGQDEERTYERELEERVKSILKNVQGVGQVDVMITLKSSKEKILHIDSDSSRTLSEEKDSAGGTRSSTAEERKETALMSGNGQEEKPVVEKELQPELAGIVISAQGGGSAVVKAEISDAMQALFNLPANKIKVLKKTE